MVQVFDGAKITSNTAIFKTLDICEVHNEELDFESKFTLTALKDTSWHCFVISFDTDFVRHCKSPIKLPTGPKATPTHWQQVGLGLDEPLLLNAGDRIEGRIHMQRNQDNHRNYDIVLRIDIVWDSSTGSTKEHCIYNNWHRLFPLT